MKKKNRFPILKNRFRSSSALFSGSLLLAACACVGQAHGQARNAYLTIQPTADKTAFVHTLSWVALDSQYSGSVYDDPLTTGINEGNKDFINNNDSFGNFGSAGGSAFEIHSVNDPLGQTRYEYLPGVEVRYQPPHAGGTNSYAGGYVYLGTDGSDGAASSPVGNSTPKWEDVGSFITEPNGFYGSGWEGVTGIRTVSPDGSGTQITGDGYYLDSDDVTGGGLASPIDDVGMALVGFDAATQAAPQTGYMQFVIPVSTTPIDHDGDPLTPSLIPDTDTYFQDPNGFWPASGWKAAYVLGVHTNNASIEVTVTSDHTYTPKLAVSGDFDGDLDVDNSDLTLATGNFTGSATSLEFFGQYYRDGDMDGDMDVDNADLGAVIGAFTPSTSSGSSTLTYDPATGNVKLDASAAGGAIITSFQLENGAGTFVPGSYTSLSGGDFGGTYEDATVSALGDSDPTLAGSSGIVDLGNVFPTGMDLTGLQTYLSTAVYTGSSGSGQQQFDLVVASGGSPTYATWSSGAAANVDTNGDGVDNGAAWALGAADTAENAIGLLPTLDNTTDPDFFIFTFNRSDDANDDTNTTIAVEYGSDLSGWTTAAPGADIVITEGTPGSTTTPVEVKIRRTLAVGDKLFARLNVVVAP